MSLTRIPCPACAAWLTSKAGFAVGQSVKCPKCNESFDVPAPFEVVAEDEPPPAPRAKKPIRAVAAVADDEDDEEAPEEDERPKKAKKKKKKSRDQDDEDEPEWSYKTSWIRFAILGVLVVVMIVLGILLIKKWTKQDEGPDPEAATPAPAQQLPRVPPPTGNPIGPGPMAKRGGAAMPKAGRPAPGLLDLPIPGSKLTPEQAANQIAVLTSKLVGTWVGTAPDGSTHRVEYRADYTYTHTVEGGSAAGTTMGSFAVAGLVGDHVLRLTRPLGDRTEIRVTFEDDELLHDTAVPGESVVLRKS